METNVIGYTNNGEKIVERLERVHTRKIDRRVAKYNMLRKRGYRKIAKRSYNKSTNMSGKGQQITREQGYFSLNWKEHA